MVACWVLKSMGGVDFHEFIDCKFDSKLDSSDLLAVMCHVDILPAFMFTAIPHPSPSIVPLRL